MLRSVLVLSGLLLTACPDPGSNGPDAPDSANDTSGTSACEACLAKGGTWQPEANECTRNCALQDISCFDRECPGACKAPACECSDKVACEAAGCTWHIEAEAAWCANWQE